MPISYDDKWCLENWQSFRNWKKMCDEYNKVHGTDIKYNTFKAHCNIALMLNYHYTYEQDRWLRENYPHLGKVKCTERFNERFGENRTVAAIKKHCLQMGLKVTEERTKARAYENTGRLHDVGTIVKKTHGEPYIKVEDGTWKRLKDVAYGEKPNGHVIVHLDGDVDNYSKENLVAIPRTISAKMTVNGFWSEEPTITKTGIMCLELEEALKGNEPRTTQQSN